MPDLASIIEMLTHPPEVNVEWDWQCVPPPANDVCLGRMNLYAWLHVEGRLALGPEILTIDRLILPQLLSVHWELDTDVFNEIEFCRYEPGSRQADVMILLRTFAHRRPALKDPDPPDDDGTHLTATTTFRWTASLLAAKAISELGITIDIPGPDVTIGGRPNAMAGLELSEFDCEIHWCVDLANKVSPYTMEAIPGDRIEIGFTKREEALWCEASSQSGTLVRGAGPRVFAAGGEKRDRISRP